MLAEISAALSSVKTMSDLVKAGSSMANYGVMLDAVNTVQQKLSDALLAVMAGLEREAALKDRIAALAAEVQQVNDWSHQAEDYVMQAVGSQRKHFVQVYKPAQQTGKARHWACAKCFQERKLYVLNATEGYTYECPNCKTQITPTEPGTGLSAIDTAYG